MVDMIKTSAQTEQILGLDYGLFGIQIFHVGSRQSCSLCVENPCQQVLTVINKPKILAFASLPILSNQRSSASTVAVLQQKTINHIKRYRAISLYRKKSSTAYSFPWIEIIVNGKFYNCFENGSFLFLLFFLIPQKIHTNAYSIRKSPYKYIPLHVKLLLPRMM